MGQFLSRYPSPPPYLPPPPPGRHVGVVSPGEISPARNSIPAVCSVPRATACGFITRIQISDQIDRGVKGGRVLHVKCREIFYPLP